MEFVCIVKFVYIVKFVCVVKFVCIVKSVCIAYSEVLFVLIYFHGNTSDFNTIHDLTITNF